MFICPICNGLTKLNMACPRCGQTAEDYGRYGDFFGPYSPYRPIEDLKLTDGLMDAETYTCPHLLYCPDCERSFPYLVKERSGYS